MEVMRHKKGDAFMYRKYSSMLCSHYEMNEEFLLRCLSIEAVERYM